MKNLVKTIKAVGLAGLVGLLPVGCGQPTPSLWTEQDIVENVGSVDLPKVYGSKICDQAQAIDIDGDNNVDALMFAYQIFRYDGQKVNQLKAKRYGFEHGAREFTPELKELANKVMHSQQNFAREYLKEMNTAHLWTLKPSR